METFDPHGTQSSAAYSLLRAVFETLVTREDDMSIGPGLATSWETPNDTTWVFKLRPGVKFHDGTAFDAGAVKYSFDRFQDPATKAGQASLLRPVKSVEIVDPQTVRLTTDAPYATLLPVLADYVFMMSPSTKGQDPSKVVVGSGRYQLEEWLRGQRIVLKANPSYWGEKPKLQQIVYRPIPEAAARLVELKSGNIDIAFPLPVVQYAEAESAGATVAKASGLIVTMMFNVAVKPFDNPKVRQAFNYAVDKQAIIKGVLQGAGYQLPSALRPGMLGYDPAMEPYPYDPAKARALLAEAGVSNLSIEVGSSDGRYLNDKLVAQAVAGQLGAIGVQARVVTSEYTAYVQSIIAKRQQFFLIGQTNVASEITLPQAFLPTGALNQNYQNPEVTALLERGARTLDAKQREGIYRQINQILRDDAPWLFLYSQEDAYGVSKRVTGFVARADSIMPLAKVGLQG